MSPPNPSILLLSLTYLFLFSINSSLSSSSSLPTIALSRASNRTLVCGLLPSLSAAGRYELNCTAPPGKLQLNYPSSAAALFSAVAAGNGFLCALSSPQGSNLSTMRWWDFDDPDAHEHPGSIPNSKRVYRGPALGAIAAGDTHVCGIREDTQEPYCWRWPELHLPEGLVLSEIAVGGDFVCGLLNSGALKCFGANSAVVGKEPGGYYSAVAAGTTHACAVSTTGKLVCWGDGAPKLSRSELLAEIDSLALGENRTCLLRSNGTVLCFGLDYPLPEKLANEQFMAIEAKGGAFCGILLVNYSLACWGNDIFHDNHMVFEQVLPGSCATSSSCSCGILPGSGNMCGAAGVICQPCKLQRLSTPPPPPPPSPTPAFPPSEHSGGGGGGGMSNTKKLVIIVVGSVGLGIGLAVVVGFLLYRLCYKSRRIHDSGRLGTAGPSAAPAGDRPLSSIRSKRHSSAIEEFDIQLLLQATNGFSQDHKIGSGSFGSVYRAILDDGRDVAIKRAEPPAASSSNNVAASNKRKNRESAFVSELVLLSRVNHKNLVRLLGFCRDGSERVLVYEYMANGTLRDHLHKLPASPRLSSWGARLQLALDAARGIEYLHVYAVPPIIHRDIKSSNILLDDTWTAKVSDFGLSLMTNHHHDEDDDEDDEGDCANCSGNGNGNGNDVSHGCLLAAGTVGYMDPEYYRLQNLTAKSDVYSFGVVLLELLSGRKVIQRYDGSGTPQNVVDFAVPCIVGDDVGSMLDSKVPPPTPCEIEAVAYAAYLAADCVSSEGYHRPTMTEVVNALERAVGSCTVMQLAPPPPLLARSKTTRSV